METLALIYAFDHYENFEPELQCRSLAGVLMKATILGSMSAALVLSSLGSMSPANAKLLKRGDRGTTVRQIQQTLVSLGFSLEIDGVFGPRTQQAVKAFQQRQRLTADGIVGQQTATALGLNANGEIGGAFITPTPSAPLFTADVLPVMLGDRGTTVRQIQQTLASVGFPLGIDGVFGPQTQRAVREFQQRRGFIADGVVDLQTATALGFKNGVWQVPAAPGATAEWVTITASSLNVRNGPGEEFGTVGALRYGTQVRIDPSTRQNGFVQISGQNRWIAVTYTRPGSGGGGGNRSAVVRTKGSSLRVRQNPNSGATIIKQLANGTSVQVTGTPSGDWYNLVNGGWVSGEFLRFITP